MSGDGRVDPSALHQERSVRCGCEPLRLGRPPKPISFPLPFAPFPQRSYHGEDPASKMSTLIPDPMVTDRGGNGEPPWLRLAGELLSAEGMSAEDPRSVSPAVSRVMDRLHEALQPLVGNGGYRAILGRALMAASRDFPDLARVPPPPAGGSWREGLAEAIRDLPQARRGKVAHLLVGEFLGFLVRLVGWSLTLSLLRGPWPGAVSGHDPTWGRSTGPLNRTVGGD